MEEITIILILTTLLAISVLISYNFMRLWNSISKQYETLVKDIAEVKTRSQLSHKSNIGSRATVFAVLLYLNTSLRVEIPVILKEKSHDALMLRFELDWQNMPNEIPFTDAQFQLAMQYQMNAWYHAGSNLVTWIHSNDSTLKLSEDDKKDISVFLEYSAQLTDDKKNKIKRLLSI